MFALPSDNVGALPPLLSVERISGRREEPVGRRTRSRLFGPEENPGQSRLHQLALEDEMPYKRKGYKRRRSYGLPPGVVTVARSVARTMRADKAQADMQTAIRAFGGAPGAQALTNVRTRRALAIEKGRGAYNFGKSYSKWAKTGTGRMVRGMGADMLHKFTGIGIGGRGMYTGRGEYTDNSLISGSDGLEVPSFSSAGDETGSVTVCRKEYVCDIYGPESSVPGVPSAFNVQTFQLNPGLEGTFPWLSQIAQNYDEYDFKQLVFTYRSTTTDIGSSTGQCGTVIMATNYNASAPPFGDKVTMMEYDASMSSKVTESMRHGVECDPLKLSGSEGKYIRNNPVVPGQDLKTYDQGSFQLAVANIPTLYVNQALGELWVSYNVELRKPKFYAGRGLGISQDLYVSAEGSETVSLPFGTVATILTGQQNNIFTQLTLAANSTTITFPASYAGFLEIRFACERVTSGGLIWSNGAVAGNVSQIADMYAGGGATNPLPDSPAPHIKNDAAIGTSNNILAIYHVQVGIATAGVDNSFTVTHASFLTGPGQSSITIAEYNSGYSYRAMNIGPLGSQSVAPILVNPAGTLVVP